MEKIFFLILIGSIGLAQSKEKMKLNGYVLDKESGEAMPYANVQVKDSPWGTMTNSDGYFALDGIPKETMAVWVSYQGVYERGVCQIGETHG